MMPSPVAFTIENTAVPICLVTSLWLNERVLGLSVERHCGIGVDIGVGVASGSTGGVGNSIGEGDGSGFSISVPWTSAVAIIASVSGAR